MQQHKSGNRYALAQKAACLALAALASAGCAGVDWIESPSEADLPLDHEVRPYPTAIAAPTPTTFQSPEADSGSSLPAEQAKPATEAKPEREESLALPATALAVVPPHLRQLQSARPPIPISLPPRTEQAAPLPISVTPTPQPVVVPLSAGPNTVQPLPAADLPAANTVAVASASRGIAAALSPGAGAGAPTITTTSAERQAAMERSRSELIANLETEIRQRRSDNPADEELPRLEQQLRLLYLAADRIDDAVASVESLDEAQREGFKQMMFGLGVWMSPDEARRAPLRSAKVLRSLRDASTELSAASKLELRNLVFCERVEQFGWYSEFPRNEFRPKQQVILYTEVENFAAEKKGQGYETELQGSYQIYDAGGRIVAERQLPLDRETCRNYRRDYFLAYPMYLPETIEPGRYRLELTVEDLKAKSEYKGRKFGEGMIEFTVRQ